jgi:hypothetical protein
MALAQANAARARQLTRESAFDTVTGVPRPGVVLAPRGEDARAWRTRATDAKGHNPALRPAPPAVWCPYGCDRPADGAVAAAHAVPPRRILRGVTPAGVAPRRTAADSLAWAPATAEDVARDRAAAALVLSRTRNYDPIACVYVHAAKDVAVAAEEAAAAERGRRRAAASLPPTIRTMGAHGHNIITWQPTPGALPRR